MRERELSDDEDKSEELSDAKVISFAVLAIVVIIVLIIVVFGSFYIISAGQRGVLLTWGSADMIPKTEGLHMKWPIAQKVVKMNIQTQLYSVEKASAASKDLQTATTSVAINYYINPESTPTIYKEIGVNYQDKIIVPAVLEVLKASTAQYTAEELITKRPEVKEKIDTGLRERLSSFGVNVQAVSITDFKFSEQFEGAIEGKVTAEQNALAAKNKLAQVEYEARQRVTQATAEAEAIKIQAQAITQQGGKDYVQLKAIEKWDGKMPQIMMGQTTPFIDVSSFVKSS